MLRMIIYGIGCITTAVLAVAAIITTLGWGKAAYDKRKQNKAEKPVTASNTEVAA